MMTLFETDLQLRLGGQDKDRTLREVRERLAALDARLRTSIRQGLAPQDFAAASALAVAVEESNQIIDDVTPKN